MLSVVILSDIMLIVIMLSIAHQTFIRSAVILSDVVLNVVASLTRTHTNWLKHQHPFSPLSLSHTILSLIFLSTQTGETFKERTSKINLITNIDERIFLSRQLYFTKLRLQRVIVPVNGNRFVLSAFVRVNAM